MIQQFDKDNNLIKEWECSVRQISNELGIDRSLLSKAINGIKPSAGGYLWKEVSTPTGSVRPKVSTPKCSGEIEVRTLPKSRLSLDWFLDPNTDYKDEPIRNAYMEDISEKEREYIDYTFKIVSSTPKERRSGSDRVYDSPEEVEGQIASHLEGGYHYGMEPCNTIKRACELLLLDYFLDDKLPIFREQFSTTN